MTPELIKSDFNGAVVTFNDAGWFNATQAAAKYGKRPTDWLALTSTKEYIADLKECMGISEESSLITAKRNSGTWLHPKLGVAFARWLDNKFAIWCDMQIDAILRRDIDQRKLRHEAASSFKVMTAVLQIARQDQGKETAAYHYSNEARLINWAVSGKFQSIDRDALPLDDLALLAKLEEKNAVLIGRGVDYAIRKQILAQLVIDLKGDGPKLIG